MGKREDDQDGEVGDAVEDGVGDASLAMTVTRRAMYQAAPGASPLLEREQVVGHFKIIDLLGRGGMGEVYLARDTRLGRRVALKLIHRKALGSQDAVERFLFEARTTAQFSHPNIVTVYEVGEHDGLPYLALEYLRGQTLGDRIREGTFSPGEAARIGLAIAEALTEAHRHHMLHRDLKPANVLLPPDGRPRVVDFGLARRAEELETAPETKTAEAQADPDGDGESEDFYTDDSVKGTPKYMAPEQWDGKNLTEAVDVWALGLILYELLAGSHPFTNLNFFTLRVMVDDSEPLPPMENSDELPAPLVDLVTRCLAKAPGERPSAAEVVDQLKAFLHFGVKRLGEDESPFRGLLPFTEKHAGVFFGRDAESDRFVEQLRNQALVAVVGPSGAGKSSFVRAGVIARLQNSGNWLVVRMRPGSRPFEALAQELLRATDDSSERISHKEVAELAAELRQEPGRLALELRARAEKRGGRVLLFVDQLEELVTLVDDDDLRMHFMVGVCHAADEAMDPVRVVLTVRDDFVSRVAMSDYIREALGSMFLIQRPGVEALEATLRNPVGAAGYAYDDPELPSEMVAAVRHEPACLPLLQFAGQQLWDARDRTKRLLLREAYSAMGGVEGALVQQADGVLDSLSASETGSARQLLIRLVTNDRTRNLVTRSELLEGLGVEAERVLEQLTKARLLTVRKQRGSEEPESTVELAHESLIARWGTLRRWLDESLDELVLLREVTQAARLWDKRGRRTEELWRGRALNEAQRLLDDSPQTLSDEVKQFVGAAGGRQTRRTRFRRAVTIGVVAALAMVAVVLFVQNQRVEDRRAEAQQERTVAQQQRTVAQQQRAKAQQQRAVALVEGARSALGHGNLLEARAKLRLALQSADAPSARALWWQLQNEPLVWLKKSGAVFFAVAFSPDGKRIAAVSSDKSVYLLDVKTRAAQVLRGAEDQVLAVVFSPDSKQLVTGDLAGGIRLWDVHTGQIKHRFSGHTAGVQGVSFSRDGHWLASASLDKTVRLWDVRTGKVKRTLSKHNTEVTSVSFSPDGRLLASGSRDKTARLWNPHTGEEKGVFLGHTDSVRSLRFSPDGRLLASGSGDRTVRIWDVHTGKVKYVLSGHTDKVRSVSFSPDGGLLASGSMDQTVRIWNTRTGQLKRTLTGHTAVIMSVSFGPDGLVVSGGGDRSVRLWDTSVEGASHTLPGHTSMVLDVSFSPDSRLLASGSYDKTVRIWDVHTGRVKHTLSGHKSVILGVDFSPDGRLLASGGLEKAVRIWDPLTGQEKRVLFGHNSGVRCVRFSPDGRLLASGSYDKTVRLWDPVTGREKRVLSGHTNSVSGISFNPAGDVLASGGSDDTVRLWDIRTGKVKRTLTGHTKAVLDVDFSPNGNLLVSGSYDRTLRVWDAHTGKIAVVFKQPARPYFLDFHPDGRRIGVSNSDGIARIWDLERKALITELRGHNAEVNSLRFSPNGEWAATASDDHTVRLWNVATGRPVWHAPLLLASPPRIFSHLGWTVLEDSSKGKAGESGRVNNTIGKKCKAAVEQRARFATFTPNGKLLCLQSYDGDLELWDPESDTRIRKERVAGLVDARGVSGGCLMRAAKDSVGRALLLRAEGDSTALPTEGQVTALGSSHNELLVAAGAHVFTFDVNGTPVKRFPVSVGVTGLARIDADRLVVGYANGNIELVRTGQAASVGKPAYSFEGAPSSPVTLIIAGPMDTLIAGYANGVVGMWSWRNGKLLAEARIHGPIRHLLLENQKLYAASSLGQHFVWKLSTLYADRCALLNEVWNRVPVVWQDGRAVIESPPVKHPCRVGAAAH